LVISVLSSKDFLREAVRGSREGHCPRSERLIAGRAKNLLRGTCFCDEFFDALLAASGGYIDNVQRYDDIASRLYANDLTPD